MLLDEFRDSSRRPASEISDGVDDRDCFSARALMQSIIFMKNFAIAGGFLLLAQTGAPYFSIDAMRSGGNK